MSDETPNPSTGSNAGHDGEQKRTEEVVHRVPHEKRLGQLEFKYQLMVEKKRLACELLKFQDLYGELYSEPCLICLDEIHVRASANLIVTFICCGGFICKSCVQDIRESGVDMDKCPLCREVINDKTAAEKDALVMSLAKRGVLWAQFEVGSCMIYGVGGFEKQVQTGLEWINMAAAQNYPSALCALIWVDLETSVIHPRFMLLVPKAVDRLLSIQLLQWVIATVDFGEVGLSHVPSALSSVQ
ncbi:hypothetical protein THAOC_22325, partial [Thalassiosira oceanica]